jgi:protein-tyrosine phosphatase
VTRLLFVCLGNICRSPLAQGVMEYRLRIAGLDGQVVADSAGTGGYHVGDPPDKRAIEAAARRDIDISKQRARRVASDDFVSFDYLLAMDEDNLWQLRERCPAAQSAKLRLLMEFAAGHAVEVPDPYYGGNEGFERALDLIESAVDGVIHELRTKAS